MRILTYTSLFFSLMHYCGADFKDSINFDDPCVAKIQKYTVTIPDEFQHYSMGFTPGLGSSMTLKKNADNGLIQLYMLCDRGPNAIIKSPKGKNNTAFFPVPDFSPFVGVIDIIPEKSATLTDVILFTRDNQKVTGLPIPPSHHAKGKAPIPSDINFNELAYDYKGVDPESLDVDGEGNFWFGEEYGPRIFKANNSGAILKIFAPGDGLPTILSNGPENRGFEALAVTPNGKVYALMESILDFDGKTEKTANFIRMVELDPSTNQTRMFAYPFDKNVYLDNLDVKIGDLAAIDETHFLLVEQGVTSLGMRNIIYIIDINDATDISDIALPEERISEENSKQIKCIKKAKLFDAQKYDWPHKKLEGIAIINGNTMAITNDNDFGFSLSITKKTANYTDDLKYGKKPHPMIKVDLDNNADTWIWIVNFKDTFLSTFQNRFKK